LADEERLRNRKRTDATSFAKDLIRARGIAVPEYEVETIRALRRVFTARFGTDAVAVRSTKR
jgi:hypothetical protein